ncbi:hypothetical protein LEP1GSC013_2010 [Leptospira interrogans serovar Valbuzzi str. Duyster]|uniref:hypothetical protein n=1 Tax=Leptospira interrogans TaxID=173 RepID=UPI0002B91715|nr:hypothetical protein [Leptospira interrogans]EMJ54588.1 hypothetical protein LEP1GSC013_2010 [Leptospira interrogans serovar Valbuzzi str. Duyster]ENO71762.1 hypothetical protein LEP1GSC012_3524 [Leptospira interrogans serovar Valbuzzi str. Valbuzzi]
MEPELRYKIFKAKPIVTFCIFGVMSVLLLLTAPFWALNGEYGTVLFIAFPFSIGLLMEFHFLFIFAKTLTIKRKLLYVGIVTILSAGFSIFIFLIFGKEGLICILMAFPIAFLFIFMGVWIGSYIYLKNLSKYLVVLIVLCFNVSAYIYDRNDRNLEKQKVQTSLEINASKKEVWNRIISPFEFGEAGNFFLRNGVSYPVSMRIVKQNEKLFLFCNYTNGTTSANVDSFENLERFSFSFSEPQVTMKETSLYGEVEPKHIRGKVWAVLGEFRLIEVSENKTKVIATTEYVNGIGPKFYWKLWGDYLIDEIHRHVLTKIKNNIEQK